MKLEQMYNKTIKISTVYINIKVAYNCINIY